MNIFCLFNGHQFETTANGKYCIRCGKIGGQLPPFVSHLPNPPNYSLGGGGGGGGATNFGKLPNFSVVVSGGGGGGVDFPLSSAI